jgi:prepilin-type N-terminal cleavage/methylation domain-containing protein
MIRDEAGFTLVELLVGIAISLVTMSMVAVMVSAATHNHDRVARRVAANQRIRPVLTRIVDELHSACVAPRIVPVIGDGTVNGSTDTRITFLSAAGDDPTPTPDKHVITLSGSTLSEAVYHATGGVAPTWTFSATPDPNPPPTLLTGVSAPSGVMFKYYRFQNGALALGTPLATPLSAVNAGLVAYVSIGLTANPTPTGGSGQDAKAPLTLSDAADLRLQPASQVASQDNLPCT